MSNRDPTRTAAGPGADAPVDLRHVKELLRDAVAALRVNQERHGDGHPASSSGPAALHPSPPPPGTAADLERRRLAAELALAREALEHGRAERERLRERVAELEAELREERARR
ncbi:MAG TPA: hypothetical protein VML50_03930 [Anaeromyxobacter sp.]|nr:hypothetical protein [Anaeromyxobacter sp.]